MLAIWGELRDRYAGELVTVPVITPIIYGVVVAASAMGIALWLSVWDIVVPRGQAIYVLGLISLLGFGAVEFLFFVALVSRQAREG